MTFDNFDKKNISLGQNHGNDQEFGILTDQCCVVGTSQGSKFSRFIRVEMREENNLICGEKSPLISVLKKNHNDNCDTATSDNNEENGDKIENRENSKNHNFTEISPTADVETKSEKTEKNNGENTENYDTDISPYPLFFNNCISQITYRIPLGRNIYSDKVTIIVSLKKKSRNYDFYFVRMIFSCAVYTTYSMFLSKF